MSDWWIVISEICEEKKQFEVLIVEARCLLCDTQNDLKLNVNNYLSCISYYVGEESIRANFNENTKGECKRTTLILVQTSQKNTTRQSDFIFFVAMSDFGRSFFLTWSGDSEDLATFAVTLRRVSASSETVHLQALLLLLKDRETRQSNLFPWRKQRIVVRNHFIPRGRVLWSRRKLRNIGQKESSLVGKNSGTLNSK